MNYPGIRLFRAAANASFEPTARQRASHQRCPLPLGLCVAGG